MSLTITDLFCGAGGSSLGAQAAGMTVTVAANHWRTAVDVHQAHFPHARHDCADISQADPRRYPATQVLLASPECTNHSQARGVSRKRQDPSLWDAPDPTAERSRATMWDVPRFAEQIRYDAVVVENVVEATKWVMFPAWWMAMESLGYVGQILSHNSMFHGVPQSRDRIFIVWCRRGLKPSFELDQHAQCHGCDKPTRCTRSWKNGKTVGRYRSQWVWRCTACRTTVEPATLGADTIIDWDLPLERIGDRKRPLAPATRARIAAGLERFGWVQPITAFAVNTAHGGRLHNLDDPHPTVCASDDRLSLVVNLRGTNRSQLADSARPTGEPVRTLTAGGIHNALVMPFCGNGQCSQTGAPLTAADLEALVDDCGFRMFDPAEVAAAMGFPNGYIPTDLTKKDRVKLAGNAVTPPVMEFICARLVEAIGAAA